MEQQQLVGEQSQELPPINRSPVERHKARNPLDHETYTQQSAGQSTKYIADALFLKFEFLKCQKLRNSTAQR